MNAQLRIFLVAVVLATAPQGQAQPIITAQPTNQSVSWGASAVFQISVKTSKPPLQFQWQFAGTNIPSATSPKLVLRNVELANAGDYSVLVSDTVASVTSHHARLEVDPTFTQINASPVPTDLGGWIACAWGDYDNDAYLDLFVTSTDNNATGALQRNALYHNNRNGTFTRVTAGSVATDARNSRGCLWADYDNDGNLDLVVLNDDGSGFPDQLVLYRNKGDGTFARVTPSIQGNRISGGYAEGCAWADYDDDGFVDLYVARYGADWLLHNNGDGTFAKATNSVVGLSPETQDTYVANWVDYDNDGWPDLCVGDLPNSFYHNNGNGTFTKILAGPLAAEVGYGCVWGDFDNDGNLDALAGDTLYHNNGDGTFTKQATLDDGLGAGGVTVGDYDNDGFLDLFLTTPSRLYHNNGDGTFTRVLSGGPANDPEFFSWGCAWGDYDNDGFLDLIVVHGAHGLSTNFLFHNNGNSNAWLKVRLVGTVSTVRRLARKSGSKPTSAGVLSGRCARSAAMMVTWPAGFWKLTLVCGPPRTST